MLGTQACRRECRSCRHSLLSAQEGGREGIREKEGGEGGKEGGREGVEEGGGY